MRSGLKWGLGSWVTLEDTFWEQPHSILCCICPRLEQQCWVWWSWSHPHDPSQIVCPKKSEPCRPMRLFELGPSHRGRTWPWTHKVLLHFRQNDGSGITQKNYSTGTGSKLLQKLVQNSLLKRYLVLRPFQLFLTQLGKVLWVWIHKTTGHSARALQMIFSIQSTRIFIFQPILLSFLLKLLLFGMLRVSLLE